MDWSRIVCLPTGSWDLFLILGCTSRLDYQPLFGKMSPHSSPEWALRGGSKTGPGRRWKSSLLHLQPSCPWAYPLCILAFIWRTDTIVFSRLNEPPPPQWALNKINKHAGRLNRGFTVNASRYFSIFCSTSFSSPLHLYRPYQVPRAPSGQAKMRVRMRGTEELMWLRELLLFIYLPPT